MNNENLIDNISNINRRTNQATSSLNTFTKVEYKKNNDNEESFNYLEDDIFEKKPNRNDFSISNLSLINHDKNNYCNKSDQLEDIQEQFKFKIILLGDYNVGKSNFLNSIVKLNEHKSNFIITSHSLHYAGLKMLIDDSIYIRLNIFDTTGEEKYNTITKQYFRDSHGVFLIFDLTNYKSFQSLSKWISLINSITSNSPSIILLGTKNDLSEERQVTFEEASCFAKKHEIDYIEISNHLGTNIEISLELISRCLILSNEENKKEDKNVANDHYNNSYSNVSVHTNFKDFKVRASKILTNQNINTSKNSKSSIILTYNNNNNIQRNRNASISVARQKASKSCC